MRDIDDVTGWAYLVPVSVGARLIRKNERRFLAHFSSWYRTSSSTRVVAFACIISVSPCAWGQEVQGFADLRLGFSPGATGEIWQLVERVRPTFEAGLAERVTFVATIEAGLAQGRQLEHELTRTFEDAGLRSSLEAAGFEWPEYANELFRINRSADYLDVDRLYLDLYLGPADIRVGRQALNWGSAQFFNPTDPFPEVLLAEPWRPRRGVNAVRAHVPFGEMHDASVVIATNDTLDQFRAAGRVRINWLETDFALVGAWRGDSETGLIGFDLRGTLELGWWIEAAYHLGGDGYEEISVGLDYSFPVLERMTLFVQYYRNGAGLEKPSLVDALPARLGLGPTGDPFAPFVLGRDYLLVGSGLVAEPELSFNLAVLQNLGDGSGFVMTTVTYNLLDWLDVACTAQVPYSMWGDGGEFRPARSELVVDLPLPGLATETVDFAGLFPTATITFWSRASF